VKPGVVPTVALGEEPLDPALLSDVIFGDIADPFPILREARGRGPVQAGFVEGLIPDDGTNPNPVFTIYGHAEASAALTDPKRFSSRVYADVFGPLLGRTMVGLDGAEHDLNRRVLNPVLRRSTVQPIRADLGAAIANTVIDGLVEQGHADLVADVALRYPFEVLASVMNLGNDGREEFRRWSFDLLAFPGDYERGKSAAEALRARLAPLLASRASDPKADVVSQLSGVADQLPEEDLIAFLLFLIPAGVESTFRSIGNVFHALLTHPDELDAVRRDRQLVPRAVDETLRWQPPVGVVLRSTTEDVVLGEVEIPQGADVVVCVASANRDERTFKNPDVFNVRRSEHVPHLTFGFGPHACIGAQLAKYELTTLLGVVLDRLPDLHLIADAPVKGLVLRSPLTLPVAF
jgi:cytochrome P450